MNKIKVSFKLEDIPIIIVTMEKLQQENKELKEKINKLSQWDTNKDTRNSRQRIANKKFLEENKELKARIDKAINVIENLDKEDINVYQEDKYWVYILYILKGGNNNED